VRSLVPPPSSTVRPPSVETVYRLLAIIDTGNYEIYYTLSTCADVEPSENGSPDPPFLETRNTPVKYIFGEAYVLLESTIHHAVHSACMSQWAAQLQAALIGSLGSGTQTASSQRTGGKNARGRNIFRSVALLYFLHSKYFHQINCFLYSSANSCKIVLLSWCSFFFMAVVLVELGP